MTNEQAKQYAEKRLKEFQDCNELKGKDERLSTCQIVSAIIIELINHYDFTVGIFGMPLRGVTVSDGIPTYIRY